MHLKTFFAQEQRIAEDELVIKSALLFHLYGVRLDADSIEAIALSSTESQAKKIFRYFLKDQHVLVPEDEIDDCIGICVDAYNSHNTLIGFSLAVGDTVANLDYIEERQLMSSWPKNDYGIFSSSKELYLSSSPEFKNQVRLRASSGLSYRSSIGTYFSAKDTDKMYKHLACKSQVEELCRWIEASG
jgi:hypothetical protein